MLQSLASLEHYPEHGMKQDLHFWSSRKRTIHTIYALLRIASDYASPPVLRFCTRTTSMWQNQHQPDQPPMSMLLWTSAHSSLRFLACP